MRVTPLNRFIALLGGKLLIDGHLDVLDYASVEGDRAVLIRLP
jgi:hypothetical protein